MHDEGQKAKIKLGPLTCLPKEKEDSFDLKGKILENEANLNNLKQFINECEANPCLNQSTCVDLPNGFECNCVTGLSGRFCEENINDCIDNPCINGECIDELNGYKCECQSGYFGQNCDTDIPPCPTEDSRYHMADNKCYFFEKTKMTWQKAKENCQGK